MTKFRVVPASPSDVPAIVAMIRGLADYERLTHICVTTEDDISAALFSPRPIAEVIVGHEDAGPVAFALFFHNFSTFLGRPGLYLEDLYVQPAHRRKGYGRAMLIHLARLAADRGCGRFEWAVLDWNAPAIGFYQELGASLLPDWRICRVTGSSLERLATKPLFVRG